MAFLETLNNLSRSFSFESATRAVRILVVLAGKHLEFGFF